MDFLAIIELSDSIEESKVELNALEVYYIEKFGTLDNGYNLTGGGNGSYKRVVTEETRKKLSEANIGKGVVDDVILICPVCGLKFSIKPKDYRKRLKNSKSKLLSCSIRCGNLSKQLHKEY